jgi:K+-sensing histidine kinase KdpD
LNVDVNQLISTSTLERPSAGARSVPAQEAATDRLRGRRRESVLRDALLAICEGDWDAADAALGRAPEVARADAACLNLRGIVCEARGQWSRARRFYGKAVRAGRGYLPAEQNVRRCYELETFGKTRLPLAVADRTVLAGLRAGLVAGAPSLERLDRRLDRLDAFLAEASPYVTPAATMAGVANRSRKVDLRGFAWAIGTVALATAVGWPLVHSRLHLANVNVLMLYLLSVIWVATHHSRAAAVSASILGVATFDFVFVEPFYTFAVADQQYVFTFAVMLLTALVISTLTDRMRKQSELARQAWERVEAEFLRNTLLSGVSHDLRTPLAAISGAAGTMLHAGERVDPGTRAELLTSIASESARMERLVSNLLDMTRLESGGLVLRREWQPFEEVIGTTLGHLEHRLGDRRVDVRVAPDMPLVFIDAAAIEQVLTNLVENVLDHTPPGTPIEVSARVAGDQLVAEVADRGPGLPAGAEQRVFEKFFRCHAESAGPRRGIGLGLALARGIVEAQGGQIRATNREGGGAALRFSLPAGGTPPDVDTSA